ncbi:sulfite exporter TauE/SafE family protein [Candidatus Sumerlaeota bacterium]|nr:sulfite exporter TauE/SafE family protein [Candidatus Sumerlaeota bacterium]
MLGIINSFIEPGVPHPLFWLFTALAVIIQGISKSGFAGGAGILSLPLMILVMRVDRVAATLLPLLILLDLNAIWHFRHHKDWTKIRAIFVPSLLGIILGAALWWRIGRGGVEHYADYLKRFIGAVALLFSVYIVARERAALWATQYKPGPLAAWIVGSVSGFISTIAHAGGPLVSLYMFTQGMGKTLFVGTVAWTFMLINAAKLPFYVGVGLITRETLLFDLALIWLIPIGSFLGKWMHDHVSEKLFNRVVLVLLVVAGIQLLFDVNLIQFGIKSVKIIPR